MADETTKAPAAACVHESWCGLTLGVGCTCGARGRNPRKATAGEYAVELARYNQGETSNPPCSECADAIPNGGLTGALVCEECAPYVPEAERVH